MALCFQFLFFLLFSLLFSTLCPAFQHSCSHQESLLLLDFKNSFTISEFPSDVCIDQSYPKTMSWNKSRDCCSWEGVTCDDITGRVIELDLSCSQLDGTIGSNSSLFHLSHLRRLNLAYNAIKTSQISKLFGNFTHFTHLNFSNYDLSNNGFVGQVPSEILKLTELVSLDLSYNELTLAPYIFKLLLTNFTKLSQVYLTYVGIFSSIPNNLSTSLQNIDLSFNNLQGKVPKMIFHLPNLKELMLTFNLQLYVILPTIRWNSSSTLEYLYLSKTPCLGGIPDSVGMLKVLKRLDISSSELSGSIPKGMFINMTQIEHIDLSSNRLTGSLPSFISGNSFNGSLQFLHLSDNQLYGPIPVELSSHINLKILDFSHNNLSGPLPIELSSLVNLEFVDLSHNNLSGTLPIELSSLVNLYYIDLSSNNLNGHVEVDIFSNMKQLHKLDLSHNRLSLLIKNNSILPKSIVELYLPSCNITELEFLRSLTQLSRIDLSMNNIHEVPSWLWSMWNNLYSLNISYNFISSVEQINISRISVLDLRSNFLRGPFLQVPPSIGVLQISNNQFFGVIPPSICRLSSIQVIDLSNNSFTGSIPMCVGNMSQDLSVLDMRRNKFEGTIPNNFSSPLLVTLNLHGNHLSGNIPLSLAKCMKLKVIDLGSNNLNDTFPSWLGGLPELRVLSLRSNNFHGKIRLSATSFSNLQILDVSHNKFIGTLPPMLFKSFNGMMDTNETSKPAAYIGGSEYYKDSTIVVNKGIQVELVRILTTWTTIDLSSNHFEGDIPSSIGSLIGLPQLNLSNNNFEGEIPVSLGNIYLVESLDLSSNQLTGTIPTHLTNLNFLSKFNLSQNHLTGRIPSGTQFQTFENDSYIGNDGLCGAPLSRICTGDKVHSPDPSQFPEQEDSDLIDGLGWKLVLIGYGMGTFFGLWIGCVMFLIGKPLCLMRFVEKEGHRLVMKRRNKIKMAKRIVTRN